MLPTDDAELLDYWLHSALYAKQADKETLEIVQRLRTLEGTHETYCPQCRKDSLFAITTDRLAVEQAEREARERKLIAAAQPGGPSSKLVPGVTFWTRDFQVSLSCGRDEEHVVTFYFRVARIWTNTPIHTQIANPTWELQKVGQYPSLVDFHLHQIDGYEAAFSDADLREWKRAITTQAHGFNVAACVYLRRVFENLLDEARSKVHGGRFREQAWPEYDEARIPERVRLVASELPSFIVEHPELYKVLSKGVHQLTEEECNAALPMLQSCMQIIGTQRLEVQMREKREAETAKLLHAAASQHAGR